MQKPYTYHRRKDFAGHAKKIVELRERLSNCREKFMPYEKKFCDEPSERNIHPAGHEMISLLSLQNEMKQTVCDIDRDVALLERDIRYEAVDVFKAFEQHDSPVHELDRLDTPIEIFNYIERIRQDFAVAMIGRDALCKDLPIYHENLDEKSFMPLFQPFMHHTNTSIDPEEMIAFVSQKLNNFYSLPEGHYFTQVLKDFKRLIIQAKHFKSVVDKYEKCQSDEKVSLQRKLAEILCEDDIGLLRNIRSFFPITEIIHFVENDSGITALKASIAEMRRWQIYNELNLPGTVIDLNRESTPAAPTHFPWDKIAGNHM